ncbi:hypothetical protein E8E14_009108 [Neopestalotiopsis sp. 37M]|nr:hypothetical protein E8E14_009108 [Neopestalotiopsis sp. 37M]
MPSFLDLVMAFSPSSKPPTYAMFRNENYLEQDSPQFAVPGLGRSGRQIQCAFNLLSVEPAEMPNAANPWPLRQAALCHTFDVVSGQTLFIILKADTNLLRRINQEILNNPEMQPSLFTNVEKSFAATLLVQLIIVEWCAENWADYIEYFETKVREKSIEGKMAPISAATTSMAIEKDLARKSTTTSPAASRQGTFTRQTTFSRDSRPPTRLLTQIDTSTPETPGAADQQSVPSSPITLRSPPRRRTSSLRQSVAGMFARASSSQSNKDADIEMGHRDSHEDEQVDFKLDEDLSFEEFQRMSRWGSELEQSIMVIRQNLGVVGQIKKHYWEIIDSHEFKQHIRAGDLTSRIGTFFKRIDGVESDLTVHRDRLEAIACTLENDKALVKLHSINLLYIYWTFINPVLQRGAALSYVSARVSEYFSRTATESTDRMEAWTEQMHSIAIKTEQETVSMHVITIFTLLFLPGTFVAVRYGWPFFQHLITAGLTQIQTFFSSGAIQWDEDGTLGADYIARPAGMKLFFMTIVPLTVVVMIIWGVIYWTARRYRKAKTVDGAMLTGEKRQ